MESHLKGNIWLLPELGLNIFPSKSTIHRAMMRLGMETLIDLNDSVLSRFKKRRREERIRRLLRSWYKEEELVVYYKDPPEALEEELQEAASCLWVH